MKLKSSDYYDVWADHEEYMDSSLNFLVGYSIEIIAGTIIGDFIIIRVITKRGMLCKG